MEDTVLAQDPISTPGVQPPTAGSESGDFGALSFPADAPGSKPARRLEIRFTGSGSEYFRIWIVNLLLTIVTLGIYFPFAKARRLRYFHENTLVADSPLSFHGDPKRMLRGYLLISALFLIYSVLNNTAPLAAGVMLLCSVPLAPLLLWSALRFRIGQTGWHGLRMQFDGRLKDTYRVFWPIAVPVLAVLIGQILLAGLANGAAYPLIMVGWLVSLGALLMVLLVPWIQWRFKCFQHGHYRLGSEVTRLEVSFGGYYRTLIQITGIAVAVGIHFVVFFPMAMNTGSIVLPMVVAPLYFIAAYATIGGFSRSRLQNLIWSHTRSDHVVFRSSLAAPELIVLLLKNSLLMLCTLGLYRPFAVVAVTRKRLQAIQIDLSLPLDQITGSAIGARSHSAGEAAADLNPLGFDIDF
ncbi:MAG: YjgN family protein [Leptothrix sp. (in: b-proteobacteria)]